MEARVNDLPQAMVDGEVVKVKRSQVGAGAVEYALVLGVITAAIFTAAAVIPTESGTMFQTVMDTIKGLVGA